jgi:hypothetical protein
MLQSYSNNDLNQFYYLNDQINQWLKKSIREIKNNKEIYYNEMYRLYINTYEVKKTLNDLLTSLCSNTLITDKNAYTRFYCVNNQYGFPTSENLGPNNIINYGTANLNNNYRLVITTTSNFNPSSTMKMYEVFFSYSNRYLETPDISKNFYPNVNLAEIVPLLYLESCTSVIPTFLKYFFKIEDGNTVDEINSRCVLNPVNIDIACGIEKNNIRCACQPCYSRHSNQSRQIATLLKNSKTVSNDPWCMYPSCASGMAFKNNLSQKRSACSNISVAGIFLNSGDFSNIDISNTTVSASSANDNGINLYGDGNCKDDEHFIVDNVERNIKCVKNKLPEDIKSLKNQTNTRRVHWSVWFIIISIVIAIILLFLYKSVHIKHKKYLLKAIIFCIFTFVFFVIYYTVSVTREDYICSELGNNLCYYDGDCDGVNSQCLDNECKCGIGFFKYIDSNNITSCVNIPPITNGLTSILTNFPYLPSSLLGGVYYFSTVIDGSIYVFSSDANFKYDGDKWQELNRFESQIGFHPYNQIAPFILDNNITDDKVFLNTNMCCVYKNKVYIVPATRTIINNNTSNGKILIYDTIENIWSYAKPPQEYNDFNYSRSVAILDGLMYTFGNSLYVTVTNFDTNTNAYKTIYNYSFGKYVYAFTHKNRIFVGGMYSNNNQIIPQYSDGYNIFEYDIVNNTFIFVKKIGGSHVKFSRNSISPNGFIGGVLCGLIDNVFYIITGHNIDSGVVYRYDIELDYIYPDSPISMQKNTTIFEYPPNVNATITDIIYKYSRGNAVFHKNGFIFIITGSGEIFRGFFNKNNTSVDTFYINPCSGISNYGQPINNTIVQL